MAPFNCLAIVAIILSFISWLTAIIATSSSDWYIVEATGGKTRIGAFKICGVVESSVGSNLKEEVCEAPSARGFDFPSCDRSADALGTRFGAFQGLAIASIIVVIVAMALLIGSLAFSWHRQSAANAERDRQREKEKKTAEAMAEVYRRHPPPPTPGAGGPRGYVDTSKSGNRSRIVPPMTAKNVIYATAPATPGHNNNNNTNQTEGISSDENGGMRNMSQHGEGGEEEEDVYVPEHRCPKLELMAFAAQLVGVVLMIVCCFYFLSSVEGWLFCDEKPCEYLLANDAETKKCSTTFGWSLACGMISWIAGIMALVALLIRWCVRPKYVPPPEEPELASLGPAVVVATRGGVSAAAPPADAHHAPTHFNDGDETKGEMAATVNGGDVPSPGRAALDGTLNNTRRTNSVMASTAHENYNGSFIMDQHDCSFDNTLNGTSRPENGQEGAGSPFGGNKNTNVVVGEIAAALRKKKPGEPEDCDLPEGNWEWDSDSQLFWSEEQQYFYDHLSGHFYEPESGKWYNPSTDEWYSL